MYTDKNCYYIKTKLIISVYKTYQCSLQYCLYTQIEIECHTQKTDCVLDVYTGCLLASGFFDTAIRTININLYYLQIGKKILQDDGLLPFYMIDISILYFRFEMSAIGKRANLDSTIKICHCSSDFTFPCCHCSFVYHFFQSLDVLEGRRYIILSIVPQNQQSNGLRSGL